MNIAAAQQPTALWTAVSGTDALCIHAWAVARMFLGAFCTAGLL
jgi:hypothetical protein